MTTSPEFTVLVVDCDDGWLIRVENWLRSDFTVSTAKNYNKALDLLIKQKPPFNLVVTEVSLDEIDFNNGDGFSLANRIIELKIDTKTIILDGHASNDRIRTALKGPVPKAVDYLSKYPENGFDFDSRTFCLLCKNIAESVENDRKQNMAEDVENTGEQNPVDIFVVMPFSDDYEPFYMDVEEVARSYNKVCKRANQKLATDADGNIMADIHYGIEHAEVVVVELSDLKPNVLFECGISYAWRKKIVLMAKESEKEKVPEILAERRIEFYPTAYGGERKLKQTLHDRFQEEFSTKNTMIHNEEDEIDPSLCFVVSSRDKDGIDTFQAIIKEPIIKLGMKHFYLLDENDPAWHNSDTNLGQSVFIEKKLREAGFIVADLSWDDPTAFYLAGLAYGLGKKYKFLYHRKEDKKPPFDIRHLKLLRHSKNSEAERESTRRELFEWLQNMLKDQPAAYPTVNAVAVLSKTSQEVEQATHILFLAAEPVDQVRLRLGQEFREIREELSKSRERNRFNLELPELSLRSRDITRAMLESNASIIHFSGHGGAGGQLFFEAENGFALPVESDILADLFKQFSEKIKCVILNACYSEKQAKAISQHVDYVVGMKRGISDKAAMAFSIGFYQALGAGKNIEEAFEFGKIQSGLQSAPEYQTPVLLKRK